MRFVRMRSGYGDQLLAEGDPELDSDHERLLVAFREQLDLGMWAAVPLPGPGTPTALLVRDFREVPRDAARVVFFPPAAGGAR